jgi:hypothetical protein
MLTDFAIRGDRNVIKKDAEKILKCKDLTIEIQGMRNVKAKVIPVIRRATETISKALRRFLNSIAGKHEIKELQKNSRIGHCTRATESANVEVQNIFPRQNNITCSSDCKYITTATLYTLATCLVSGTSL